MRRILAAAAVAALLTSCSTHTSAGPRGDEPRAPGLSNLRVLIGQLRNDVALTSIAGGTLASARTALADDSDLYAQLVAYDDFGVCRGMVASAAADEGAAAVANALAVACGHLQRAAELFTHATTAGDPRALLDAAREARRSSPALVRAALALDRVEHPHGARTSSSGAPGPVA
jgi:hypothetical protein